MAQSLDLSSRTERQKQLLCGAHRPVLALRELRQGDHCWPGLHHEVLFLKSKVKWDKTKSSVLVYKYEQRVSLKSNEHLVGPLR